MARGTRKGRRAAYVTACGCGVPWRSSFAPCQSKMALLGFVDCLRIRNVLLGTINMVSLAESTRPNVA